MNWADRLIILTCIPYWGAAIIYFIKNDFGRGLLCSFYGINNLIAFLLVGRR